MGGLLSTGPTLSSFAMVHCLISPICIFFNNKKEIVSGEEATIQYNTKLEMVYRYIS